MGHRQATRISLSKLNRRRSLQIETLERRELLAAFTPGNLVLYRVGDGTVSTAGNSTAIFLDEYSPAGVLVQSLAMPTAASGANKPLTASNEPTALEGLMSRSADGRTLIVPGYATAPGTATVNATTSASVRRAIGVIDAQGNIDTSTTLSDTALSTVGIRSATSSNGTDLWATGSNSVLYAAKGATTSTAIASGTIRSIEAISGKLYGATQTGLSTIGSGFPKTAGQTLSALSLNVALGSANQFVLLDLDADVPGVDTLYVADEAAYSSGGGIRKYSLSGSNWSARGRLVLPASNSGSFRSVTSTSTDPNSVTLFFSNGTSLYSYTDVTGPGSSLGNTVVGAPIATAGANMIFRSVAYAPFVPNQSPVLNVSAGPVEYHEDAPAVVLDGAASVTDANSTDFSGGTLTVSITTNSATSDMLEVLAAGQITVTNQSIAFAGDTIGTITPDSGQSGAPLVITFAGAAATPTAISALLRSIAYRNSSQQPGTLPRSVEWLVTDGDGGTSNLGSSTIHVTATNDAPTLSIAPTASSYTAGTPAVLINPAALISDIDATVLTGATLQVSINNTAPGDLLGIASQGLGVGEISVSADKILYEANEIGTFTATNGLLLSFNGTATLTAVQALLRRLSYRNTLNLPQLGQRTIMLQFLEGDATAAGPQTALVNVLAAPVAIIDGNLPGGNGQSNGVADTFRLVRNGDSIELYQNESVTPSHTFPLATTEGIELRGSLDADTLIIDQSGGPLTLPITLIGNGGSHDTLIVHGTSADDALQIFAQGAAVAVQGTSLDVTWTDPSAAAGDELVINGGDGHDMLDAHLLTANRVRLTLHGGAGNDTLLGSPGSDTLDGGVDFDTLLISGSSAKDLIRVQQPAATSLITTFNAVMDTDTLSSGSIERLHLQAGDGDDELQVELGDALTSALTVLVTGGAGDDTLQIVDVGQADLILHQLSGAVTIGPRSATPLRISFAEINTVRFLDDAGEPIAADFPQTRLLVLPTELLPNDSLLTATSLTANGASIATAIDPTGDSDYYRVQADVTGTLELRVLFSQLDQVPVSLRPGLPGAGNLRLQLFDSAGALIIDQNSPYGSEGSTDNERLRFPVVQGEIYYVRVSGATVDAINGYTISALNAAASIPFELQLAGSVTNQMSDLTPTLNFHVDDSWLLNDLPGNVPDERIGIPFRGVTLAPGYRVAIFDSHTFLGYATATTDPPTGDYTFDCSPLTPGSHHFTAKVEIVSLTESLSFGAASVALSVLIDDAGPSIASVRLPQSSFNLFASQPASWGPTPLVSELELVLHDSPRRDSGLLSANALNAPLAAQSQHYELRGELLGVITIASIAVDQTIDANEMAISSVRLAFAQPLLDDRYTLTVFSSLSDVAGNALAGGDYVTSFFVDSRSELGTWQSGAAEVDLNGNGSFDPGSPPVAIHGDLTYHLGNATDAVFSGNFHISALGAANGFDKLAVYGVVGGQHRFLIDTDHDGVPDNEPGLFPIVAASLSVLNISGLPIAGRFDGNNLNGDEVGLFDGDTWYFDTNHNYVLDSDDAQLVSELRGVPVVGDFDGDGFDDLATWHAGHFRIDLANGVARGWDGTADFTVRMDLGSVQARPIATDWNRDGIDDLGLWLPDSNTSPDTAQWYWLLSGKQADGTPIPLVLSGSAPDAPEHRVRWDEANQEPSFVFTPAAGDIALLFGAKTALPLVGNFDPLPLKVASGSPGFFTNPTKPLDVDNDGEITVTDAAYIVNNINAFGFRTLTSTHRTPSGPFYDIDGDRQITAIDALTIINHLNTRGSGEPPAELDNNPAAAANATNTAWELTAATKSATPTITVDSDKIEPTVAPIWIPPLWLLPVADDDLAEEPAFDFVANEWEELFEHLAAANLEGV